MTSKDTMLLSIMKIIKILALISSTFVITSCASIDISRDVPFKSALGTTLILQRNTYLKTLDEGLFSENGISFLGMPPFALQERCNTSDVKTLLPKGTKIRIFKVRQEDLGDLRKLVAYGEVTLKSGVSKKFGFSWGMYNIIHRAPWESDSIPTIRHII
jgi:hypothetical protein